MDLDAFVEIVTKDAAGIQVVPWLSR